MNQFTFQSFAREFARLSVDDFSAAGERYFRYRGMDPKTVVVEKHFLDFLHFLDLEEILLEYQQSVGRSTGVPQAVSLLGQKSHNVPLPNGHSAQISQKSSSRVKRAFAKLETIQVN